MGMNTDKKNQNTDIEMHRKSYNDLVTSLRDIIIFHCSSNIFSLIRKNLLIYIHIHRQVLANLGIP